MKIVQHPFHASIVPEPTIEDALWHYVVRRDDSGEVLARHNAASKEDACAAALLEIVRLKRNSAADQESLKTAS